MTEHPDQVPTSPADIEQADGEQEWPTHCEACGTELESAVVQAMPEADVASEHHQTASPATVVSQDFCPNPDCPAKRAGGSGGEMPNLGPGAS